MDDDNIVADGLTMDILETEELLTAHGLDKPYKIDLGDANAKPPRSILYIWEVKRNLRVSKIKGELK